MFDTNRQSRKSRCKIISGTAQCESSKLHTGLPLPDFSHFHRRAGTEEFDGKKKSPQLQQDKKRSIKDLAKEIKRWILEEDEMGNRHGKDIPESKLVRPGPGLQTH